MRIAVYANLTVGGADRALYEILRRLSNWHKIDLYSPNINSNKQKLLIAKLPLKQYWYELNLPKNFFLCQFYLYTKLFKLQQYIAKIINEKNYDAVLVSDDFLTKSPILLRYVKSPSIYFCQSHYREFYDKSSLLAKSLKYKIVNFLRYPLKWIDRENLKYPQKIIANSLYLKNRLAKIYRRNIDYIKLGVNIAKLDPKISRENYFLTIGPLAVFKGMDFIIRSIALLPQKIRYPLVIVTNGGRDSSYILNLAKKLSVKIKIIKVIFYGINDKKLVNLLQKALLFLYAPYNEPFGLVALEAMSLGVPVIGVNEGGIRETIINDKNGWLTIRDEKTFSIAIEHSLDKVTDKFREQTRNSVLSWTWDRSAKQLNNIIDEDK